MVSAAHTETVQVGEITLALEVGRIAPQAHGAVVVRQGRSVVLATVVSAAEPSGATFFPLTVEYREQAAAGGRIPGAFGRREGRISDREILTSRIIDRTLRPLFAGGYRCETQVLVTVFSADPDSDLEGLGLIGASTAVCLAGLPFRGPVAGLRIARVDGAFHPLPGAALRRRATLDFVVSASREGLVMLEGGAQEISGADCLAALDEATAALAPIWQAQERLVERAGRPPRSFEMPPVDPALEAIARDAADALLEVALGEPEKQARRAGIARAREATLKALAGESAELAATLFERRLRQLARDRILAGQRIGGRGPEEVRPIDCEVGLLPACHGSALFTRGETQALVSATLGTKRDAQMVETLAGRSSEHFLLHYNFPPYSVGEIRPMRGPGRREIGHGALARRALAPLQPSLKAFPYTVRIVSDITSSNGSSSMATVCGGSLALMDAGVPLRAPVAGIAMGLIRGDDGALVVLSDILGDEDHLGDMDFKVTGTEQGITALQLDNKLGSLPRPVLEAAFAQARAGLDTILQAMSRALSAPRDHVVGHAPQAITLQIPTSRLGALIGPGGRTIKSLQAETGARVEAGDDGQVRIYATSRESAEAARRRIESLTLELRLGGLYLASVQWVKAYGALVRIADHQGLVHVRELDRERVASAEAVVGAGQEILVRVLGVDDRGRLRLSRRAALDADPAQALNRRGKR